MENVNIPSTEGWTFEKVWFLFQENERKRIEEYARWEKRMKKLEENYGGYSKSLGEEAEYYFFKAFKKSRDVFGEHFTIVTKNVKAPNGWEYDIILVNDTSIGVIEVKHKLKHDDVKQFVYKKLPAFRESFPQYKDYRIYAGVAAMVFKTDSEQYAIEKGLYVFTRESNQIHLLNDNDFVATTF